MINGQYAFVDSISTPERLGVGLMKMTKMQYNFEKIEKKR